MTFLDRLNANLDFIARNFCNITQDFIIGLGVSNIRRGVGSAVDTFRGVKLESRSQFHPSVGP